MRVVALLIAVLLLACSGPAARGDTLTEWLAHREQQRLTYEAQLRQDRLIPTSSLSDILRVRVDAARQLRLETRLPTTPQENCIVRLHPSNRYAVVHIVGGSDPESHAPVVPMVFALSTIDFSQERQIRTVTVNAQPTTFTLSRSVVSPNTYQWVQLLEEQNNDGSASPGLCQLIVNKTSDAQGSSPLTLQTEDFWSFLRKYPDESEQYVRPLLRELGQEPACTPDPLLAWQVFSDLWHPNLQVQTQVTALLPELDNPSFHVRNRAVQALANLGRDGAAVMVHLDRATLSTEQNAQIDRALAPYEQLSASQAAELRSNVNFLLDCLYGDDLSLRTAAASRLEELLGPHGRIAPDAQAPEREASVASIRRTLQPAP